MAVIFNSKTETQNAAIFNCKTETKNAGADERGRGRSGVARALNAFACSHAAMQGVTVSVGYEGILRRLRLEVTAIKFSLVSVKNATTPLNEGRRE